MAVVSSVINISFPSITRAGIFPAFLIMFEGGEKMAKVEIRFDRRVFSELEREAEAKDGAKNP